VWAVVRGGLGDIGEHFGLADALAVFTNYREVVRCVWVSALPRAKERLLSFGQVVVLDQKHASRECAIGITALIGAEIRGRGSGDVTSLLQQRAELRGGTSVAAPIRARQRFFGLVDTPLFEQEHREPERAVG
jgi:hypothetical protein